MWKTFKIYGVYIKLSTMPVNNSVEKSLAFLCFTYTVFYGTIYT